MFKAILIGTVESTFTELFNPFILRVGSLGPTSICSSTGGAAWDVCALPIWSN